jgi:Tol biopolymer transport system component
VEEPLLHAGLNLMPSDWSPDGAFIAFTQQAPKTSGDLWLLPMTGDRKPVSYLQTPFNEQAARFFPAAGSGQWMAYQSNESGVDQVYVQAIPATGAKYQISTDGGTAPRWRADGKEIFYVSASSKVMAVPITPGPSLQIGSPQELFASPGVTSFEPSRDGARFLVNAPAGGDRAVASPITVVTNWQTALQK